MVDTYLLLAGALNMKVANTAAVAVVAEVGAHVARRIVAALGAGQWEEYSTQRGPKLPAAEGDRPALVGGHMGGGFLEVGSPTVRQDQKAVLMHAVAAARNGMT